MSSVVKKVSPWTKEPSKPSSQQINQENHGKESQTGLGNDSDADSHEGSSESEDDDLNPLDPEKKKLAEITQSHRRIIDICLGSHDSSREKTRRSFNRAGQAREDFVAQYKDFFCALGDDKKTLLHHIAKKMTKRLLPLLRWLLKTYPSLILEMDTEDHTALFTAISNSQVSFVEVVCEHSENKMEALQQTGVDGTCFHKALERSEPAIIEAVHRMMNVLGDHQAVQTQGDRTSSSPLRNVLHERDKEGNTLLHIALTSVATAILSETNSSPLVELAIEFIQKHPEIMYERNKKSKSPYDCLGPVKNMEACGRLLDEMKKGIMRELSHDEVINLLYTDSESELSIFFDITQFAGRTIPVTELDGWGTHIRFERILQHVDLPNLKISGGDDLLNTTTLDSDSSSNIVSLGSRLDFVKIFNWLRRVGGVRKVLEANVEDDEIEPHCDEAIEIALQGLDIETLNWKRLDLCSDVLKNAVKDVNELFLYSSGNNDVLRSWSAEDGLARLQKLRKVHLSIRKGSSTVMRIAEHKEEFRMRLAKYRPEIVLCEEEASWNKHVNESGSNGIFGTASRHPWLDCMYNFAMVVKNNHRQFNTPEVKIGIIDDGIDDRLPIFRNRIAGGKSFLKRPDRADRTIDYWVRPGGHGTQMAKLVCQIFPHARLYIIRLDEGEGEKGERQIKIDSAIKAVDWAVQSSVHVISMSWSIHSSDVLVTKRDALEKSMSKAYNKGITMFCAASDHGRNTESAAEDDLPAAFIYPIKIGAARADGNPWAQLGYEKIDFYLPGHKIVLDDYQPAKGQPQSGSSLATAVAAGLAALLQYCRSVVRVKDEPLEKSPLEKNPLEKNPLEKSPLEKSPLEKSPLETSQTKQAFMKLCASASKFPEVERTFGDIKTLERPSEVEERYRRIVAELRLS